MILCGVISLHTFSIRFAKKIYFVYRKILSITFFILNIVVIGVFVSFDKEVRKLLVDNLKFTAKGLNDIHQNFENILIGLSFTMMLSVVNISYNQILKDDLLSTNLDGELNMYGKAPEKPEEENNNTHHENDEEEEEAVIGF